MTTAPFNKILIANRGEIACRAMRTAKKMGITTVAVFSEADQNALHTRTADEAVCIGPAASAESYLRIDKIIQACKDTGAQAVYPGYGFLSENSEFATALEQAGIAFIGPGTFAIESMGDKITSKKMAIDAGVSTVPGHTDIIKDSDHAVEIANSIGFPVMLKASAGGGGKGMRVAYDEAQCREGFERASNEARSSFGDDRIFIEKFIEQPRHIEIQVLADKHGNTVYLNERECSIQRRHQKVIEEAPSPFLDEKTRAAMGEQACALAKAVDYHSAGTVEFIVDVNKQFYFLEMNTRLQVEHPVTEMITGLDLVEEMINIAADKPLPFKQTDVQINGWSMEARVYAENPFREFLPSTGRLTGYAEPTATDNTRIDSGVEEGGEVSIYYDPMISKLITWGSDRAQAIEHMQTALDSYRIEGVTTNIPFLAALFDHHHFREGDFSTNFIEEHYPSGFERVAANDDELNNFYTAAAISQFIVSQRNTRISGTLGTASPLQQQDYTVFDGDNQTPVKVTALADGVYQTHVANTVIDASTNWTPGAPILDLTFDKDLQVIYQYNRTEGGLTLSTASQHKALQVLSPRAAELHQWMPQKIEIDTSKMLLSPMPGLLVSVLVKESQQVTAGDALAVVEAMKMENVLKAEKDGVVAKVYEAQGATLEVDQKILEFK